RAVAAIDETALLELTRSAGVDVDALGLAVRRMRSADVRPFAPVEPQPAQVVEHHRFRLARGARLIRVLDADQERAAVMLREQPVEDRRARTADVQMAGGRWGEADPDRHVAMRSG